MRSTDPSNKDTYIELSKKFLRAIEQGKTAQDLEDIMKQMKELESLIDTPKPTTKQSSSD